MAKIGTAHIEIKPVLNDEALAVIVQRIEDAVADGVARGLGLAKAPNPEAVGVITLTALDETLARNIKYALEAAPSRDLT